MATDQYQETTSDVVLTSDQRFWAMLCHLSGLASYLGVVPFASIIGPLIVWLLKRDSSPFVDAHGKEAVNFQITMSLVYLALIISCFLIIGLLLLWFVLPFLALWILVLVIVASIKAINGEHYRYPLTIRLIK